VRLELILLAIVQDGSRPGLKRNRTLERLAAAAAGKPNPLLGRLRAAENHTAISRARSRTGRRPRLPTAAGACGSRTAAGRHPDLNAVAPTRRARLLRRLLWLLLLLLRLLLLLLHRCRFRHDRGQKQHNRTEQKKTSSHRLISQTDIRGPFSR